MTSEKLENKYPGCPPPGTWLRNRDTGDLAQVIEKDGEWWIKPDLPLSPVMYPATQHTRFLIETQPKKLPPGSYARVAYEADRALCTIHPDFKANKEWISLNAMERAKWLEGRIEFKEVLRMRLYTVIVKLLEEENL